MIEMDFRNQIYIMASGCTGSEIKKKSFSGLENK